MSEPIDLTKPSFETKEECCKFVSEFADGFKKKIETGIECEGMRYER